MAPTVASLTPFSGLRLPRRTARLRLTLFYGGLFLVSGVVLLAITNLLVRSKTGNFFFFEMSGKGLSKGKNVPPNPGDYQLPQPPCASAPPGPGIESGVARIPHPRV